MSKDLTSNLAGAAPSGSKGIADWVPLLAAGVNFFSNMYSNWRNESLVERQNEMSIEQWNRENRYNSPVAQMARLAAAGINPNLAYSNGQVMNEAAASPSLNAARVTSPLQIDPAIASQIELNKAQARSLDHSTDREDEKQGYVLRNLAADTEKLIADGALARSSAVLNDALTGKAKQEQQNLQQQWEQNNEKFSEELRILKADSDIKEEEARRIAESLDATIKSALALARYNDKQADFVAFNARTGRISAEAAKVSAGAAAINADINVKELPVKLQQLNAELEALLKNNEYIDATKIARIIQEYAGIVGTLVGAGVKVAKVAGAG